MSCAAGAYCTYRCGEDGGLSTHVLHMARLHAKRPLLVELRVINGPFEGGCRLQSGEVAPGWRATHRGWVFPRDWLPRPYPPRVGRAWTVVAAWSLRPFKRTQTSFTGSRGRLQVDACAYLDMLYTSSFGLRRAQLEGFGLKWAHASFIRRAPRRRRLFT